MLVRHNSLNRENTYLLKDYYKTIVLCADKGKSEARALWLMNSTRPSRGVYSCPYNKTQMVFFLSWPGIHAEELIPSLSYESILIFADTKEELELIKPEMKKYDSIEVIVVISSINLSKEASDIDAYFIKNDNESSLVKTKLDRLDKELLKRIKNYFLDHDKEAKGFIQIDQMKKISVSLGEKIDTEEFKQTMLALDLNGDGSILFPEFVSWWKFGRTKIGKNILTQIYFLKKMTKELIASNMDYPSYLKSMIKVNLILDKKSQQKIYLRSPGQFKLKSFIEAGLSFGGPMKKQMTSDYISQLGKQTSILSKNNWISIIITLKDNDKMDNNINETFAKQYLKEFKENIFKNSNPVLIPFIKNFVVFEYFSNKKNVVLNAKLKSELEEVVKGAIHPLLLILKNLSEIDESFWFNIKTHSNCDIYEKYSNGQIVTFGDYLKTSEFLFDGANLRSRLKTLFKFLESSNLNFLRKLFIPYDLELELDGDLNEFNDEHTNAFLDSSLENLGFIFDLLKKNISSDLLKGANNIEIGLNIFDVFMRTKFYCKSFFLD